MSSLGDPATRLVVDLAAYQPIEDGVNLSIHNVRLRQICPAKKRRRFLRRRPAQNDATGANHVRKEGILIIGADRFVFGMVEGPACPLPDKDKERQERVAARQKLLEEKAAARQQRIEEKEAMKQQKQEEKASQKASKEAARVLIKQEKERLKVEKGSSRTPSMDRSGSRPLLMKRAGSSPQVVLLTDSALGLEQKTPEQGSSSRLSTSAEAHDSFLQEPVTPGTPYRASRSYSNLGQVISDSESGTPFAPSASSPLAPPRHQRSVSTMSNGALASSTLTSPFDTQDGPQASESVSTISNGACGSSTLPSRFDTQDDITIPASPLFQQEVEPDLGAPKQSSLDVNGFPRIAGLSSEQHTFTADIAFSQVLRIERELEEVTVFYRPNTMRVEELSRNPVANALAVTFLMPSEQAAGDVVSEVERAVEQYSKGVGHLCQKLPLPGPPSLLLVSHKRIGGQDKAELITVSQPMWGNSIIAPASWDTFEPDHLQGPDTLGATDDVLQIYVNTPLGTGLAQLSLPVISSYLQDEEAHIFVGMIMQQTPKSTDRRGSLLDDDAHIFVGVTMQQTPKSTDRRGSLLDDEAHIFVGVTMQQTPKSTDRRGSLLVRRSIVAANAPDEAETSSSSGAWQPQDTILEVEPSPASAPGSISDALPQRIQVNGFGRLPKLPRPSKSKHVRLHCILSAKPPEKHSWQSTFGLGSSNADSASASRGETVPSVSARGSMQQSPVGVVLAGGIPVLLLLLNRKWWLLLQVLLLLGPLMAFLYPSLLQHIQSSLRSSKSGSSSAGGPDQATASPEPGHPAHPPLGITSQKWRVKLLRAEIVDDVFAAVGPSIAADVRQIERAGPKQPESKLDVLVRVHGVTRDVAERYLMATDDKIGDTHKMLQASREWREVKLNGKDMLKQEQPHYDTFKALFTHGVLGISHSGRPIWVMKLGEVKRGLKAYKASGASNEDFQRHVMFVQDYMYEILDRDTVPGGRSIWIIDMKGVGLTDLGSEAMDIIKGFAGIVAAHYPERLYRNFIVNAPGFFSLIWRVAEPMLSPTTRRKIRLLHNKQDMVKSLTEEMDEALIPQAYGGQNAQPLYESKHEVELRELVRRLNRPDAAGSQAQGGSPQSDGNGTP